MANKSIVRSSLVRPDGVVCVDDIVDSIDVVALKYHVEHFWLVDSSFLHELNDFVLVVDGMVHIVVKLYLDFIFKLSGSVQEFFLFNRLGKVLAVFGQEVELADMGPGVESVTHWVHGPDSDVLSSSEQIHSMDLLIK